MSDERQSVVHGERLAALEVEIRLLRQTLDKVSDTLNVLVTNQLKLERVNDEIIRLERSIVAFDSDLSLLMKEQGKLEMELKELRRIEKSIARLNSALANMVEEHRKLELELKGFKFWATSRYWAAAAILGALITGIQLLLKFFGI